MSTLAETPAERIAGGLALAIHQRLIRPGERLPSQSKLMASYGVAIGTPSAALGKLAATGLIRTVPGAGTFAVRPNPVLDFFAAASLCRTLTAHSFGPGSAPVLEIRVGEDVDTSGGREGPLTRRVDVSALEDLDRHVLRWMSEALLPSARRLVADGPCEGDAHVIATARRSCATAAAAPRTSPHRRPRRPHAQGGGRRSAADLARARRAPRTRQPAVLGAP
ncbi:GntR family transcriptional regulator [Streptomyces sp. NPDC049687]|uniref:GntR family transcriptional regulator n=1 Tax=Streptomyces sp. NPDC049687 TaxID=3365596 RepID=UPI0037944A21